MSTVKWGAAPTSRGTVLSTEMNSLGNGSVSALGTEVDNATNLDRWGWAELNLASLTPTAGATIYVYLATAPDGTNYDDGPGSANPGSHMLVATMSVTTGAGTKRAITSNPFALPPTKCKLAIKNQCGVSLAASGNTLELFTGNESVA